ncbi:uncharacterized protein J3D65DRAFT_610505 [Phyllosticta citribraziliensis]|uniref:Core domain-containing protein n=1 Tax=Phyllosticta citribraziliensis TaxID=989973 RepID=A0ABR1MA13_9PEZI
MALTRSICHSCLRSIHAAAPTRPRATCTTAAEARRAFASLSRSATSRVSPLHASPRDDALSRRISLRQSVRSRILRRSSITRPFSSSLSRRAAILNPRQDEDGNEMILEITPRAAHRLKQIMENDKNPDLLLRITVESGGCHGFQYLMSVTDMSQVSQEEDTIFEGDHGARVVLDESSLEILKGSKVDYTMELIGSQFKIVDNPAASSSCGCGTSFDIKM